MRSCVEKKSEWQKKDKIGEKIEKQFCRWREPDGDIEQKRF